MEEDIFVLYHCPCPDGAYAALAAYLYFQSQRKQVHFVPHEVFNPLSPAKTALFKPTSHLYLLDYSGPDDFVSTWAGRVARVTVLDHHKSAQEAFAKITIPPNVDIHFDMNRSGATIALDYFLGLGQFVAPTDPTFEKLRKFYSYIEDNDLWRKVLPNSNEFSAGMRDRRVEFDVGKNPNLWTQLQHFDVEDLIKRGSESIKKEREQIAVEMGRAFRIKLGGSGRDFGSCLAVVTIYPEIRSTLGNELAQLSHQQGMRAIGVVAYVESRMEAKEDTLKVSLRSIGEEDTTVISLAYGGGGHKNASSFSLKEAVFNAWKAT